MLFSGIRKLPFIVKVIPLCIISCEVIFLKENAISLETRASRSVPENRTLQKRLLNAIQTDEYYSNFLSSLCSRALSYHIALPMVLQSPGVLKPILGTKTIE
jgi:hypothetical protein